MKKIIIALSVAIILSSCTAAELSKAHNVARLTENNLVGLINPFAEVKTLAEAEQLAGFTFDVPSAYGQYDKQVIRVMKENLIEVIYQDDKGNEGLRVRKGIGNEDVSGDYNVYETTNTLTIGTYSVVEKRNGDNVGVVTWTDGNFSYSVSMKDALLKHDNFDKFIMSVK